MQSKRQNCANHFFRSRRSFSGRVVAFRRIRLHWIYALMFSSDEQGSWPWCSFFLDVDAKPRNTGYNHLFLSTTTKRLASDTFRTARLMLCEWKCYFFVLEVLQHNMQQSLRCRSAITEKEIQVPGEEVPSVSFEIQSRTTTESSISEARRCRCAHLLNEPTDEFRCFRLICHVWRDINKAWSKSSWWVKYALPYTYGCTISYTTGLQCNAFSHVVSFEVRSIR